MKKLTLAIMFSLCTMGAGAQKLVLDQSLNPGWAGANITNKNKPEGRFYRLRNEVQVTGFQTPQVVQDLELYISEPISTGYLALYRLPLSAPNYKFYVVLYNERKVAQYVLNLCELTGNDYCEVQDVRWDPTTERVLFNMACPSYSSEINGRGSKLYCVTPEGHLIWETGYLTSNDIFILDDEFVYCAYGFTSEKDYIFLLDKNTGRVYSKLPVPKKIQYLELQERRGKQVLFAADSDDKLYTFRVDYSVLQSPIDMTIPGGPKAFTLVYATSSDGFLNVREEPSMKAKIIDRLNAKKNGLGHAELLKTMGEWSRIFINGQVGYVYNKYMGKQTWYTGKGSDMMIAYSMQTPIYCDDFDDEGNRLVRYVLNGGVIIADQFSYPGGDYYVLSTPEEFLYVKRDDILIKSKR